MRISAVLGACVLGALLGCGGEPPAEDVPKPAMTPTTLPPAAAAPDGAYELDVIVEAEPDEGAPPLAVQFHGYIEEDEGGPWAFAWDFGDGNKSTEQNPRHTYEKEGEYTATLVVTDQRKYTGSDEIDVFVEKDE